MHVQARSIKAELAPTDVETANSAGKQERESGVVRLLTVGNSFAEDATFFLARLARSAGGRLVMLGANLGGHTFEQHTGYFKAYEADQTDPVGTPYLDRMHPVTGKTMNFSLRAALEAERWDYITVQQASMLSFRPDTYEPFAGELIEYIRRHAPQAEILVHETIAYREDSGLFGLADGFDQQAMYERLRDGYAELAKRYGLRIIPVGTSYQTARATPQWAYTKDAAYDFEKPLPPALPNQTGSLNIGYYWGEPLPLSGGKPNLCFDPNHSNEAGKYLGACTFYEVLWKEDVRRCTYHPDSLTAGQAAHLREVAHTAVASRADVALGVDAGPGA